ncbi:MAG: beta-lactamase family protein [Flavobacteriaceae bacterium]|nr:beta-lactamase family protein [Flavobacteriaceae bacterium]
MLSVWDRLKTWVKGAKEEVPLLGKAGADKLLSDLVYFNKVPGLAITLLKKGKIFFQKGYGYSDMANVTLMDPKETLCRAASASKPIASLALGKMMETGNIDPDASFYNYVPYFPKKEYDFTIRQLAGHTAGIRGYRGKEYALNKPLSIKDSLDIFKEDALLFEPDKGYHYNSYDWVMLSLAMQEVSGIPFEAQLEREILHPLGLRNTRPEVPDEKDASVAKFYSRYAGGFKIATSVDNRYKLAGGGFLTTSDELAQFGQACLEQQILNRSTWQELWRSKEIDGQNTYYGLGWEVSEDHKGRKRMGHTGNGVGGYSNFYIYPNENVVVSILINCTDPKVQTVLDRVTDILISES